MEIQETTEMLKLDEKKIFHGSTISFSSINYSITVNDNCFQCSALKCQRKVKEILFNLNGIFKPGVNAILGPTGSGKSTLLDILAARKDRQGLTGEVLLDGQRLTQNYKYRVGYVVQEDVVSGMLTVRENLAFSANVRLPKKVTSQEKNNIVARVISQLGLEKCADSLVGNENSRGVSGGERRRTNIGMELVLSPTVLFLDEPTTGLDSSTAQSVMECLEQLSKKGRKKFIDFSLKFRSFIVFQNRYDHLFDTSTSIFHLQTIRDTFSNCFRSLCLSRTRLKRS